MATKPKSSSRHILRSVALASSIAALLGLGNAKADLTWDSTATATNNWSLTAGNENWLPGPVLWTQDENAIFDITSGVAETIDVTTAGIIFNNMTFDVTGFSISSAGAGSLTLSNDFASTITVTNSGDTASIAETIADNSAASSLTKAGAGTLVLSNTNTYTGGTIISGGILEASLAGALGTGAVTNNGTLNLTATTAGDITYTGLSTSMSGSGILNVSLLTGTSTRILSGDYSAFNGTINIGVNTLAGGGKVQLNGLDHTDTSINVNTNATLYVTAAVTKNAEVVLNGGDTGESLGQLRLEGGANWAGGVTIAGNVAASDFTIGGNGTSTISGVISETGGSRALSKGGSGAMTLSNANTYTGTTTVSGTGSLIITNNSALGSASSAVVVNTGSSLELGNGISTPSTKHVTITGIGTIGGAFGALRANTGSSTWGGNVIIGSTADTRIGANAAATLTITGSVLGNGAAQAIGISGGSGTGKVILNPTTNNNYAGATTIIRGILQLGKGNIIPNTSPLILGATSVTDAAQFNLAGFDETIFSLARTGTATNSTITNSGGTLSTLTLDGTGGTGSTTYLGTIQNGTGNIKLVKVGGTTQVLQNLTSNTFTGGVDIKGGGFTLDFTQMTTPTNLISASNAVSLAGGGATTLTITGKATGVSAQTFNGTTLNTGNTALVINRNGGTSATLNFGALTRNDGAMLNFQPATAWGASTASTTEIVNTTGINGSGLPGSDVYFGAWATTGTGTNTRYAQFKSTGQFITGPTSTAATAADFSNVTSTGTVYSYTTGSTLAANQSGYALIHNATTANTVALGANTLTLNGILSINTGTSTYAATSGSLQVGADNELVLNTASGNLTISAPIINKTAVTDSRLTIGGAGTTTLSGANTYGGATTLNGSTLSIASDVLGAVPVSATPGNLTLNGGTLSTTATMNINANRGVALNGTVTIAPAANTALTIPGIIAGRGVLTKSTAGTLILSGANTFTGPASGDLGPLLTSATITGGTLVLANPSALGAAGNSVNLGTQPGAVLEFATDSTVNGYGISTSSTNPATLVLNRATPGAGFNHALGMAAMGNNVFTVTAGANITSGTPSISITGINLTAGAGGSMTFNPINTSISVNGPVFIGSNGGNAKTLNLGGTSAGNSVSGNLSNGLNTVSLAKSNTSTWTVSGNNSHTGAASVTGGTLKLDYSTNNTSKLADGAPLTLGGGTLEISGGSHNEVVSTTTLTANTASNLTQTNSGTGVIQLNAITVNNGALLNIGGNGIATTDTLNNVSTGILGPWATVTNMGVTDWAINSTNAPDGAITAYSAYTDITRLGASTVADGATTNVRIINGGSSGNITLGAATTTINTLKMGASDGAATIELPSQTLSIGGNTGGTVLQDSTSGSLTIGSTANDGILTTGATADATAASLHFANMSATNALTINSVIADNGTDIVSIAKSGAGKVTLAGTNTFTGAASVSEGVLEITGTLATTAATANTGGTLRLSNAAALAAGATVTFGASGKLDLNGNSATISNLAGDIAGIVTDDSAGTGVSTLTITTAQAGTVNNLFLDGATRDVAVSLTNTNSGHSILSNAGNTFSGGLILAHHAANGTRLLIGATPTTTGAPGALTSGVFGTGPIIVGQANTDKAGIYINGNNVIINNAITMNTIVGTDRQGIRNDATGTVFAGTLTAGLSDFMFSTNNASATSASVTGQITGSQGVRLGGLFGSALTVTLANAGTANNYAGDTTINSDAAAGRSMTLTLGAANQIPNGVGKGNVVINTVGTGVGTLNLNGFNETINGLSGSGTVTSATGADLTVGDNDATSTFSGTITNSLNLTKIGTGTLTLSGANTYGGTTTINAGVIKAGNAAALGGTGSGTTVNANGTFDFNGIAVNAEAFTLAGGKLTNTGADQINAAKGATTVTANSKIGGTNRWDFRGASASLTVNSGITLTKEDANLVSVVGRPMTNDGTVQIDGGVFAFHLPGTYGGTGSYTVNSGGELQLGAFNGATQLSLPNAITSNGGTLSSADSTGTGGAPVFAGDIALTTATTTTLRADQAGIVSGNFTGNGALSKTGTGTFTLSGANAAFTGTTAINAGTLLVSGSISGSAVTVNDGGTLGGTGSVGALTAVSGGTIAPGASPGILSSGALSMTTGSTLSIEINGTVLGTDYDQLSVTGAVDITGASLSLIGSFNGGNTSDLFTILLNDGNSDAVTGTFAGLAEGSHVFSGLGQDYTISYIGGDGNDIVLTAVPEPGSAVMMLGGLGALLGLRRRRRRA